jgi:hypothetical protein
MLKADFNRFSDALNLARAVVDKPPLKPEVAVAFFRQFEDVSIDEFLKALKLHQRDRECGMFAPTPAHIRAKLHACGPARPSAEEAWGIALQRHVDRRQVATNDEIEHAFEVANSVLAHGDSVGARIAFKQAYERRVAWHIECRIDPTWKAAAITENPDIKRLLAPSEIDDSARAKVLKKIGAMKKILRHKTAEALR